MIIDQSQNWRMPQRGAVKLYINCLKQVQKLSIMKVQRKFETPNSFDGEESVIM